MNKFYLQAAAILLALAVALGAFGAHALKSKLTADALAVYETAVKYHFYHALGLLAVGIIAGAYNSRFIQYSGNCLLLGILFFSGSLYLLSFTKLNGAEGLKWLGAVTPIGGVMFILGWIFLFLAIRSK